MVLSSPVTLGSCFLLGNDLSPSKMKFLSLHSPSDGESDTAYVPEAYSRRSHSWHLLTHVGGPRSCGRRLRLMVFKGTVVTREQHAIMWLHHAVWAAPTFQELIVRVQFIPWESIIIIQEILGKVEGRTQHSQIVITI